MEEELRQTGVDPKSILPATITASTSKKNITDLTVDEVLYESLVQLFDRVGQDIQLVARIVQSIIIQPLYTSSTLIWRYTSPTIMDTIVRPLIAYIRPFLLPPIQQLVLQSKPYIIPLRDMVLQQYHMVMNDIVTPFIHRYNSTLIQHHLQQWYDHQRDEVQLGIRIVRALILPLYQSISMGYRTFLQPMLHNMTVAIMSVVQTPTTTV